jgi:hypothetical protein
VDRELETRRGDRFDVVMGAGCLVRKTLKCDSGSGNLTDKFILAFEKIIGSPGIP